MINAVKGKKGFQKTHGHASHAGRSPEYPIWVDMVARCHRASHPAYHNYGGRGIVVCATWRNSFEAFIRDVGQRPTDRHCLDRIDNNRGYTPANVKWRTRAEQNRNTRRNVIVTIDGKTMCVKDWAVFFGLNPGSVRSRIHRGWSPEEALLPC